MLGNLTKLIILFLMPVGHDPSICSRFLRHYLRVGPCQKHSQKQVSSDLYTLLVSICFWVDFQVHLITRKKLFSRHFFFQIENLISWIFSIRFVFGSFNVYLLFHGIFILIVSFSRIFIHKKHFLQFFLWIIDFTIFFARSS